MIERQLFEARLGGPGADEVAPQHGPAQAVEARRLADERDDDRRRYARDRVEDLPDLRQRIVRPSGIEMAVGSDEHLGLDLPESVNHALHAEVG